MLVLRFICLGVLATVVLHPPNAFAEKPADAIKYPVETTEFEVIVTDDDGQPIEGATLRASGLRVKESPGSYYGWPYDNVGEAPVVKTDGDGKAVFRYPKKFGRAGEWVHTITVCYYIEHAEHIKKHFENDSESSPATAAVDPGCELVVSAVDPNRQTISNLAVLVAGNRVDFLPGENPGEIRSRAIPHGRRQVMLIGPDDETGVHLFSKVRKLPFAKSKRVSLRGLMLRPGLRISGRLADKVQRPVRNGSVIALSIPMPDGSIHQGEDASVGWVDAAEIKPDGTFTFPSIPPTGSIQMIAICDGWVIDGRTQGMQEKGLLFELAAQKIQDNHWDDLEIPMKATTTATIILSDPDGKPVVGAEVGVSPNQLFDKSGSQLLGNIWRTLDFLNEPITFRSKPHPLCKSKERYTGVTDKDGVVVLRDIPQASQWMNVIHDKFRMKRTDPSNPTESPKLEVTDPGEQVFEFQLERISD